VALYDVAFVACALVGYGNGLSKSIACGYLFYTTAPLINAVAAAPPPVAVEIETGARRIISYLLSPLARYSCPSSNGLLPIPDHAFFEQP
jgi:hypothetical protein